MTTTTDARSLRARNAELVRQLELSDAATKGLAGQLANLAGQLRELADALADFTDIRMPTDYSASPEATQRSRISSRLALLNGYAGSFKDRPPACADQMVEHLIHGVQWAIAESDAQ